MTEEESEIVDSVTEATNGIGSEALAAITNLGGGSGSAAGSVLSRLGATISGRTGGFAPKVITTVTKHGLAAINRVEPIQDVNRGYRAVARDANGLESIRTVLDLDPREYDVTVTREDGVAIVEFVQQEPDLDPALPPGSDNVADSAESNETATEPMAPVTDAGPAEHRDRTPATNAADAANVANTTTTANRAAPLDTDGSGHEQPAPGGAAASGGYGREVERARAQAEKSKAQAEAEKARAEAERAKAEAEAAKARAEAERAKAEADTEAVRSGRRSATDSTEQTQKPTTGKARNRTQFSASRDLETGFDAGSGDDSKATETAGGWGLRDGTDTSAEEADAGADKTGMASEESDDSGETDGFGDFTPATPVEDEPPEYADGGTIEANISVHDDGVQDAVADGGTEGDTERGADKDTGKFQF